MVGGRGNAVGVQERGDAGGLLLEGGVHDDLARLRQPAAALQQRQQRALAAAALRPCANQAMLSGSRPHDQCHQQKRCYVQKLALHRPYMLLRS